MLVTPDGIYEIKSVIQDMSDFWNQEVTPEDDLQREWIGRLIKAIGLEESDFLNG